MALDLKKLKEKYLGILSSAGKSLSGVANSAPLEGLQQKYQQALQSSPVLSGIQSGLKQSIPQLRMSPSQMLQEFTRQPGARGSLDPGSLYGAFTQANQSTDPRAKTQFNLETALDVLPGVAATSRTKAISGTALDVVGTKGKNALNTYKSQIGSVRPGKSIKQGLREFYTDWVNRTQPIESMENFVEKATNSKMIPQKSPTFSIKQLLGAGGKAELRHKQKLQPILDSIKDVTKDDFDAFLKAKRDVELGQRGIYGSDPNLANSAIVELGNKYDLKKLDEAAQQLYSYQRENLEALRDAGFLSREAVEKITSANQNYVPFQRIMDDINEFLGLPTSVLQQSSQPIKKIKGSVKAIESPIESIIANTYRTEAAVAKNRVAKSIVNLKSVLPTLPITESDNAAGAITVWDGGIKRYFKVPADIEGVVKGLNEETMDTMTQILSAPARLLRQQATGRNLEFMIPNAFRDQFDAAINSEYGYKPFIGYLQGLSHLIKHKGVKMPKTNSYFIEPGDELVEKWINSGGKMFFENMSGMKAVKSQIEDATKRKNITKKLSEWVIGGIDTIGEFSETPTRIGLFENALKKTGNELIAARESREATLDFARRGAKMKTANALVPFLNVGVQGFDRMLRTIKNNPAKATVALMAYGAVPSTMVALYNNLYHGEEWQQIPDYIKQDNFVIITGGKDKDGNPEYFTLPKSHLQKFAANPAQEFVTYIANNNPQDFQQFALNFFGESLPVVEGGDNLGEALSKTVGSNLPQFAKIPTQIVANFDFYRGKQIVPWYLEKKPKPEQTTKYTPEIYNKIGTVLNLSPLKVKNFMETTFAGGIKQPINIYKTVDAIANGAEVTPNDIFITRRFFGSQSGYDIERPEPKEGPGFTERLGNIVDKTSAAGSELPTIDADFEVLYKDAMKTLSGYKETSAKIRTGLKDSQTLEEAQTELVEAKNMIRKMEKEQPEKVYKIELGIYTSGGGMTVDERAEWVIRKLSKATDDNQLKSWLQGMLSEKVITKSVLEKVRELGFNLNYYNEGGKVESYSGSSKKKKVVVPKIPSGKVKKVSPKIIKPSETKIVTPSITKVTKKSVKEFNPSFRRDKIMSAKVRT